jgi:hypothetical protein
MKLALATLGLAGLASAAPAGKPTMRLEMDYGHSSSATGPQPWRGLQGLNVNNVPSHVDPETNDRHYAHDFLHEDDLMGITSLQYTAVVPDHVKMLDEMPVFVHDLSCTQNELTVHTQPGTDAAAFAGTFEKGDIVIASSGFGCHSHQDSGRDHGRHLHEDSSGGHAIIRRVTGVTTTMDDAVVLTTTLADFSDALQDSDISFKWTPPHHGEQPNVAAGKRAEIKNSFDRRELSVDVDAVIKKCREESTLDFLGNADLKCSLSEDDLFDFYADLFSVNYNPIFDSAMEPTLFALDDTVRCDNCYATMNFDVSARIKTAAYKLKNFEVTVSGGVHAEIAATLADPTEHIEAYLTRAFEELDVGGCLPTIEFYVSHVPVRIKPCWDLAVEYESNADLPDFSVRSGFVFDANATIGIQYDSTAEAWSAIKDWDWDLSFYKPLWDVNQIQDGTQVRLYVLPELLFTVTDIIPLMMYPKPFLGLDFNKLTSSEVQAVRAPSVGQGIWKVFVEKGNGFTDPDGAIFKPDMYAEVSIMGCTSVGLNAKSTSANLLYGEHLNAVASVSGGTLTGLVFNPGCDLKTSVRSSDSSPTWNEWLNFENAPMFKWEAAQNEKIKVAMFDSDGVLFGSDDKRGEVVFDATGAVMDGDEHSVTLDMGSGATVKVIIKWELSAVEGLETSSISGGWAPESVQGCWRPDGYADCQDYKEHAMKRRLETCSVGTATSTCACKGLNARLNYGLDVEIGVGEIDLPFEFEYSDSSGNNMDYSNHRLFAGILQEFVVIPPTDLVSVSSEGCVATLKRNTLDSGWIYKAGIDPTTGKPIGWVQESKGLSALAIAGIVAACFVLVGGVVGGVIAAKRNGGAGSSGPSSGGWVKRMSIAMTRNKSASGIAMSHKGTTAKEKRGSAFLHGTANASQYV